MFSLCYIYGHQMNYFNIYMSKTHSRGKNSKAVAPQKNISISRKHLAEFFGLSVKSLIFAIAETPDGDGGVTISPIVAILGKQEFISLAKGEIHTTARVQGLKQDLYPAIVLYKNDTDSFCFKSSVGAATSISTATLVEHFGAGVINTLI